MDKDGDKQQQNLLKSLKKLVNALGSFRSLTPVTVTGKLYRFQLKDYPCGNCHKVLKVSMISVHTLMKFLGYDGSAIQCGILFFDSLFTSSRVLKVTERLLRSMAVAAMMGFKRPAAATGMLTTL